MAVTRSLSLLQVHKHTLPMIQLHSSRKYFPQTSKERLMMTFSLVTKHLPSRGNWKTIAFSSLPYNYSCPILYSLSKQPNISHLQSSISYIFKNNCFPCYFITLSTPSKGVKECFQFFKKNSFGVGSVVNK